MIQILGIFIKDIVIKRDILSFKLVITVLTSSRCLGFFEDLFRFYILSSSKRFFSLTP